MSMRANSRIPSFRSASFRASFIGLVLASGAAGSSRRADCPSSPPTTRYEEVVDPNGLNSTVGLEQCGRFLLSWQIVPYGSPSRNDVLVARYSAAHEALEALCVLSVRS